MRRLIAVAALAALPLAACGDDDDAAEDGGGSASQPEATGGVKVVAESVTGFDSEAYDTTAGEVTIRFENDDSQPHNVVIEGQDFKLAEDGEEGTIELAPGEYTLFCDVPGHRAAGMEATLTVE